MSLPRHGTNATAEEDIVHVHQEPYDAMAAPLSNAEGREAMTTTSSSSEKGEKADYRTTDVEAARPMSDSVDSEEGKNEGGVMGRFRAARRSRAGVAFRDFLLIGLLLGWWIPGILREVRVPRCGRVGALS